MLLIPIRPIGRPSASMMNGNPSSVARFSLAAMSASENGAS